MRFVDRNAVAVPPSLALPSAGVQAEKTAAERFYITYDPLAESAKGYDFKEYKGFDVQTQLRSLFRDKCAYCESELGGDLEVEHFRPKLGVTEERGHPGYWWLAHNWNNLLPSCTHCNQSRRQHLVTASMTEAELTALLAKKAKFSYGKANQFPISGRRAMNRLSSLEDEKPHLLDPTLEDPEPYLSWSRSSIFSVVLAKPSDLPEQTRALSTIQIFALNRAQLVKSRTSVLNELRYQAEVILQELEEDMLAGGDQRHVDRAMRRASELRRFQAGERPYTAMAKAFIDEFIDELAKRVHA